MAIVATLSNHFFYMLGTKKIDFENDTFMAMLMDDTFVFDKDAHATKAVVDALSKEVANGNGYTTGGQEIDVDSVTENDTDDRLDVAFVNPTWTADGGSIGPTGSILVYDDTTADKTIIGCIDYGADYTIAAGSGLQFQNVAFQLGHAAA